MSEQGMKILVERNLLPGLTKVSLPFYEHYVISKQHRLKFKTLNSRSVYVLELVHSDVWQAPDLSLGGTKYFISFIDDYSRRCWVYPIKKKSHVFEVFKVYKAWVKLDSGKKIKCLRTDNGGEYTGYADGVKGYRLWDPTAHKVMEKEFQSNDSSEAVPQHEVNETTKSQAPTTRTLNRERKRTVWQLDYVMDNEAMQEEIEALHKNKTWELVPLPGGKKPIGNKWVYKIKRNSDDQVERYRARLVVKGYAQKEGINFNKIFSHVVLMTTVRVVLAMCATYDLHLEQLDVKNAFLHGNLEENIYMLQPEGPNKDRINKLKAQLTMEFEMKYLGCANKILGMPIHRDRVSRKIWMSQNSYVKKILQRFNMQDCKPISTPFPTNFKLSSKMSPNSKEERIEMSRVPYRLAM
ncbi:retrovirus-related pol polyprotein from transposon TNT 1-94 [Tanacetum coccineum]